MLLGGIKMKLLVGLLFVFGFVHAQNCAEGETFIPRIQGEAPIISDEFSAKDEAERDAQRRAIETNGVIIESSSLTNNLQLVNDVVNSRTVGVISSSEILETKVEDGIYYVFLQACVGDVPETVLSSIKAELESLGYLLKQELGNPRIVIKAQSSNLSVASVTEIRLADYFTGLGFSLRNAAVEDCQSLESLQGIADILICANIQAEPQASTVREGMFSARATLRLEASRVANNQIIASINGESGPKPAFSAEKAANDAVNEGLEPILEDFTSKIIQNLNASTSSASSIEITVTNIEDLTDLTRVKGFVQSIRGVESLIDRSFSEGEAVFEVEGDITLSQLLDRFSLPIEGVEVAITGYSDSTITVTIK